MSVQNFYRVPPVEWSDDREHRRLLAEGIANLYNGKTNATGTVTLTAGAATTTLSDRRIGQNTVVLMMATTANAAAEVATLYQTFPNTVEGQAVLNHANNAQADRTFAYALLG